MVTTGSTEQPASGGLAGERLDERLLEPGGFVVAATARLEVANAERDEGADDDDDGDPDARARVR